MRLHAPEIEDEPWCPAFLRDGLTDFLAAASETLGLYDAATPAVAALLQRHNATRLVDLCSGAGGPMLRMQRRLARSHGLDVEAVLTDLYPNQAAFRRAEDAGGGRVRGLLSPTDAACVPEHIVGVRTIFNGFHHFRPELARRIVVDAARKRQPFISIELAERRALTVATVAGTPLAAVLLAPFRRPTLARLLCTWVVPIIPAAVLWDGLMSCLRAYSPAELQALTADLNDDGYAFRIEQVKTPLLPTRLTMLIGEPR